MTASRWDPNDDRMVEVIAQQSVPDNTISLLATAMEGLSGALEELIEGAGLVPLAHIQLTVVMDPNDPSRGPIMSIMAVPDERAVVEHTLEEALRMYGEGKNAKEKMRADD